MLTISWNVLNNILKVKNRMVVWYRIVVCLSVVYPCDHMANCKEQLTTTSQQHKRVSHSILLAQNKIIIQNLKYSLYWTHINIGTIIMFKMNSMKKQKDMTLEDELPRSVAVQYATGEELRNNSRKKRWNQSQNNTQLWIGLVMKLKSDAEKKTIA